MSKLGVQDPTTDIILAHINRVCKSLGKQSESNLTKLGIWRISNIMKRFYEYTKKPDVLSSLDVKAFQNIPFVFVSNIPGLFPCEHFARHLDKKYEMKPYLMAIPDEFLGYIQLFETLGVTRNVSSETFAKVLHQINSIADELNANELKLVGKAMKLFFEFLSSDDISKELEIKDLFLLSKEGRLANSKSLLFMNLPDYDWIQFQNTDFDILSDIDEMDNESLQRKIKNLPAEIRPKHLSDVIKLDIDIRHAEIQENDVSKEINDFFKCDQFINGVLRLVKKEHMFKKNHSWVESVSRYKENLHKIQMIVRLGCKQYTLLKAKKLKENLV